MTVRVQADGLRRRLARLSAEEVPEGRRRMTQGVMREVLRRTVARNPVDTGRSRAAWARSLEALGGTPPAGWEGSDPDGAAIEEGAAAASLSQTGEATRTEIQATNAVEYVPLLEFGTREIAAQRMAGRSLAEVRGRLRNLLRGG